MTLVLIWCAAALCEARTYDLGEVSHMACLLAGPQVAARDPRPGWRLARVECKA